MSVEWEPMEMKGPGGVEGWRSWVPGGWLVLILHAGSPSVTFMPDAEHIWDGFPADGGIDPGLIAPWTLDS